MLPFFSSSSNAIHTHYERQLIKMSQVHIYAAMTILILPLTRLSDVVTRALPVFTD